ncbi:AraC family transcriptional regulator [Leptospira wolffii]|uniref:helix-turn-helix domain-containing protein n=1 Tax=Leptospira wolffii TaxID=409998 RepID=UPI00108382A9|nr:AraC family transcriptional regulator [Leptospira wolffii]TGL52473.1 AraC family transcriptional regulator [Leptospira wolffii]
MDSKNFYREQALKITSEVAPKSEILERIIDSKRFIDRRFDSALDLDAISGRSFLSKFHFLRIFKSVYGMTPHRYLTFVRIDRAKRMLKEGVSVSEVSARIGFESTSTFSGTFKKYAGLSPSSFRSKYEKQF